MSDDAEGTRGQSPDDVRRVTPPRTFEAGEPVPGLSSWVLERKLGGGGFGEVWLARHAWDADQKPRAVKFCTDPAARHRLVTHEKNVVVRVMKYAPKHPNIVPLLDCNLDGNVPWLMYEFVEGYTLAAHIAEWRDLPTGKRLGRAVRALHAVAGALATCHRLDPPLVHRDMKPANVLMAGTVPRVTDFGIGSVVMPDADSATGGLTAMAARLPSALQSAGTRLYAPPEQMYGSPPAPRDDVYALGIIAYQMIVGDLKTGPGPDADAELRDLKIPAELRHLIVSSVALNPDRRPTDAGAWESTLAVLLEKARETSEPTDTSGFASKPVLLIDPTPKELPHPVFPSLSEPLEPVEAEPERRKPRVLLFAGGSVLACGLLVAVVLALLPTGKPTEPTQPTAQNGPKGDDTGTAPNPKEKAEPKGVVPKAGEERAVEIAPGVTMTFCWVPAGECQLGSPKSERDVVLKSTNEVVEPEWLQLEAEDKRGKFKTDGYWMGKHEVTQAQWKAVTGNNPSEFDGIKDNKAKGMDTSRFPVEQVSWDTISGTGPHVGNGFLNKVNAHGGVRKAFGKDGTFVLPHEDQWEYACRGGRGNARPFYWGDKFNGTQANIDGNSPYGTPDKGTYLDPYFPDDLRLSAWHVRRNPGIPSVSASFLPK
ncbi:MAG: hypothetical protein FJ304_17260 [Planctomycetes bacterium]|nr:hypothetical protein [Planctomycetota bacterium]